jgi:hypothetical protein
MTRDVAKLGQSKMCAVCGGETILQLVQHSAATLGWVDDRSTPYELPSLPMWRCEDCHDLQAADDDLDA